MVARRMVTQPQTIYIDIQNENNDIERKVVGSAELVNPALRNSGLLFPIALV